MHSGIVGVTQSNSAREKKQVVPFPKTLERRKDSFFPLFVFLFAYFLSKLQLLADQNLRFIDPFCKIAAKTKE